MVLLTSLPGAARLWRDALALAPFAALLRAVSVRRFAKAID